MIKNLILFCIFLLLISGCSKSYFGPDEKDDVAEKQLLSLNVTGFSQELVPFVDRVQAGNLNASLFSPLSSSGIDLRDYINTLEFKVYHKSIVVDSVRQYSDDTDFGKYENYFLPDGVAYRVFIAGAMLNLESSGDIEFKNNGKIDEIAIRVLPEFTDAFVFYNSYMMDTEVEAENIQLKRFVGRLEINLTEEIPYDAEYIEITIHNTAKYYMPFLEKGYHLDPKNDSTAHNIVKKIIIKPEDIGRLDYSTDIYFILKSKLGGEPEITNVTIKAVANFGQKVYIREVQDVNLQANMRTKLNGRIFSNHPNKHFELELDSDWDSEVPEFRF